MRYSSREAFYKRHPILTGLALLITMRWLLNPRYTSNKLITAVSVITVAYILGKLIQEYARVATTSERTIRSTP